MIRQVTLHDPVVKKLGGVGIGTVRKADDARRLKFLLHEVPPQPEAAARFQREQLRTLAVSYPKINPGRGGAAWA